MVRTTLLEKGLRRVGVTIPAARVLLAGDIALLAGRHIARLDGPQRRRLLSLARQARARPSSLAAEEREELMGLLAILEPRLFVGSAVKRLSPVPLPGRLLFGPRRGAGRGPDTR